MTTILYDRPTKTIGVDSRNTDSAGQVFMCNKIEVLSTGWYFLGSGHCYTIEKARRWADTGLDPEEEPEFPELFDIDLKDDFGMSCLIISPDGETVTLIDDEMTPMVILDDVIGVGSGGAAARAARKAGASVERAVEIAIEDDGNSGGPVRTHVIVTPLAVSGKKKKHK